LNFSEQISFQIAKSRQLIGYIFKHITTSMPRLHLFKHIVRPLLEQCPIIYSSLRKCDRIALENVQRSFTKCILGTSCNLTYRQRCEKLRLEPLWLRRLKLNLTLLFRIAHGHIHTSSFELSFTDNPHYELRNKEKTFSLPYVRTTQRSNYFTLRYSFIWNKLPEDLRTCNSISKFKKLLARRLNTITAVCLLDPSLPLDSAYEHGLPNI
jgi:hypothetical protein